MSRNGSGVFSLAESAFVFDTIISETEVNSNFSDIGAEITNSVATDGQTTMSGALKMGANKLTGVAVGTAQDDGATLRQVQAEAYIWCGTATGTADAITLTPSPAIAAYAAGQRFVWIASASPNTGAMTIDVSALGTKAAQNDGSALAADDHVAGKLYQGIYDGTQFQILRVSLSGGSGAVLTLPQINDTSKDHQYIFGVNELTADRTITLPLLTGNDVFVFEAHIQTLTNKTLTAPALTSPTLDEYVDHAGNVTARFGFPAADTFRVETGGGERLDITDSGLQLGNANARVTTVLDEDDMSSDSATSLITQQSAKDYIDKVIQNSGVNLTLSGTSKTFSPPAGTIRIAIIFGGVSLTGTDDLVIRLGDSGGVKTTGYIGTTIKLPAATATDSTTGWTFFLGNTANSLSGTVFLDLLGDADTPTWGISGTVRYGTQLVNLVTGRLTLSLPLETVQILVSGTDTFDAGAYGYTVLGYGGGTPI